ncbi:MAG: D-alanyl-D-alanine carboxypeptidase [Butyrivibrio sp.]|nr:D-alanyl-D-alanine carboxypeptidase [Butyrivibrio sp.]
MKIKKLLIVICPTLLLLFGQSVRAAGAQSYTAADAQLELYARAAVLIDGSNNRILYGKNENEVLPMASTTKIMTLVIALENADLNATVTVSPYAASQPDVQLNALKGEQYKLGDLLYVMMLKSYNDVAAAIAEYVGEVHKNGAQDARDAAVRSAEESRGYVAEFASLMNKKAAELGCTDTYFITPNGLDAQDDAGAHSTTAFELAKIAAYAVENESVIKICTTRNYSCSELNGKRNVSVATTDRFLDMVNGAVGLKTGFTGSAGYCFVGAVKHEGRTFISVVLASGWPPNKNYKWSDTKKLMNYGIDNFFPEIIFASEERHKTVPVADGTKEEIGTYIPFSLEMLIGADESVKVIYELRECLMAPIGLNEQVGTVYIYLNGECFRTFPILSKESVAKRDYFWFLKKIWKIFCL